MPERPRISSTHKQRHYENKKINKPCKNPKIDFAKAYLDQFKGPPVRTGKALIKKVMKEKGLS